MRRKSEMTYRIIIVLLCISAVLLYTSTTAAPDGPVDDGKDFTSYGYSYVKVRNIKTQKLYYMIADQAVNHCCGDMQQLAALTLSANDAARDYIMHQWEKGLGDFNLQPNFVKCLRSKDEAEANRNKKVELFKGLGHQVIVIPMKQDMAGGCK